MEQDLSAPLRLTPPRPADVLLPPGFPSPKQRDALFGSIDNASPPGHRSVGFEDGAVRGEGRQRLGSFGDKVGTRVGSRRVSEDISSSLSGELMMMAVRSERKLKTMPDLKGSRRDDVSIPPQARAQLHKLHEEEKLKKGRAEGNVVVEDMSEAALEESWGRGGSWHVFGEMPPFPREKAFNVRPFQVWPRCRASGEGFLLERQVGALNTKGRKGSWDTCRGQDACSVSHLSQGWEVLCLMDGHGPSGEWPAMRAVQTLPYVLQSSPSCITMLRHGKVDSALHHAFDKVQLDLAEESLNRDIDLQVAGCTAVCVVQNEAYSTLWVATAGDSRAVLLVQGQGAVAQTVDHKPSVESERARLEKMGCEVVRIVHEDGFVEERVNIAGEDFPGLCMSRSLGDLAMKDHGVLADPEVVEWNLKGLKKEKAYVLAASDGVWEFLSTEAVAELVLGALARGSTCLEACQELVKTSQETWAALEDEYCDDVTAVLVPISWGSPRRRPSRLPCTDCGCVSGLGRLLGRGGGGP